MEVTVCSKEDYDQILTEFNDFWEHDRTLPLHHPTITNEFGNSSFVIKEGKKVIAYLFGFLSQMGPVGYVHLISVRQGYRNKGLGRQLYDHFTMFALEHGCTHLKAITSTGNTVSIAFHKSIGMMPTGPRNEKYDVPVVINYGGPGKDRVIFMKQIV
jgi:GNAT superfamily N-acetyltransferase